MLEKDKEYYVEGNACLILRETERKIKDSMLCNVDSSNKTVLDALIKEYVNEDRTRKDIFLQRRVKRDEL